MPDNRNTYDYFCHSESISPQLSLGVDSELFDFIPIEEVPPKVPQDDQQPIEQEVLPQLETITQLGQNGVIFQQAIDATGGLQQFPVELEFIDESTNAQFQDNWIIDQAVHLQATSQERVDEIEKAKRRLKQEKNRIASRKCREKKALTIQELLAKNKKQEEKIEALELALKLEKAKNAQLQAEINKLPKDDFDESIFRKAKIELQGRIQITQSGGKKLIIVVDDN